MFSDLFGCQLRYVPIWSRFSSSSHQLRFGNRAVGRHRGRADVTALGITPGQSARDRVALDDDEEQVGDDGQSGNDDARADHGGVPRVRVLKLLVAVDDDPTQTTQEWPVRGD